MHSFETRNAYLIESDPISVLSDQNDDLARLTKFQKGKIFWKSASSVLYIGY